MGLPLHLLCALTLVLAPTLTVFLLRSPRRRWQPAGQLVLVTGASQGLGLSLAEQLAEAGAEVVLVARREAQLQAALDQVRKRATGSAPRMVVGDVSSFEGAQRVLAALPRAPDTVICAAGGAKPGMFLDMTASDFQQGIQTNYLTTLATVHASATRMRAEKVEGTIVIVSSMVAFCGLVGYGQYSPMKSALRGLAETLRSEFLLYNISVHCYFPATILSPGFVEEEKTKPALLREIEQADSPLSPAECAARMLKGLQAGHFFITSDWQTDLFRALTAGIQPGNSLADPAKALLASIALPIWRKLGVDAIVRKYRSSQ